MIDKSLNINDNKDKNQKRISVNKRYTENSNEIIDCSDSDGQILNIHVKERESERVKRSARISSLFKESPSLKIKGLFTRETQGTQETRKRPLTGLFRRPSTSRLTTNDSSAMKCEMEKVHVIEDEKVNKLRSTSLQNVVNTSESKSIGVKRFPENFNENRSEFYNKEGIFQLDSINMKNIFLAKIDDLDLSLLSRFLCCEEDIKDEEMAWTWDYIFANISTEMREEWSLNNGDDDEEIFYENRKIN